MRVYDIMAKTGEGLVNYSIPMSNFFAKATILMGAGLVGYGIEDNPLLSIAGGTISIMGLVVDKVRERVVIEKEREKAFDRGLEAAMEPDDLPL